MAFSVGESSLSYQENCFNTDEATVCAHYVLEEYVIPEDEAPCAVCDTNWVQRLTEVVKLMEDKYTTSYPCMAEGGMGNIMCVCPARVRGKTISSSW